MPRTTLRSSCRVDRRPHAQQPKLKGLKSSTVDEFLFSGEQQASSSFWIARSVFRPLLEVARPHPAPEHCHPWATPSSQRYRIFPQAPESSLMQHGLLLTVSLQLVVDRCTFASLTCSEACVRLISMAPNHSCQPNASKPFAEDPIARCLQAHFGVPGAQPPGLYERRSWKIDLFTLLFLGWLHTCVFGNGIRQKVRVFCSVG